MIGEILIIGLELAILARMNGEKQEPKVEHKTEKKNKETRIAERKEPKISNSGERFVQCPLEGYRSYYLVGDWGTIKQTTGKVLTQGKRHNGKKYVYLSNGAKATTFTVERLVALAYLIRPAKGDERHHKIVHKNGIVDDNRANNLMWE